MLQFQAGSAARLFSFGELTRAEQLNCAKCANLINSNGEVRLPQPPPPQQQQQQQQQQEQQQQTTEQIPLGTAHSAFASPRRALAAQQRTAAREFLHAGSDEEEEELARGRLLCPLNIRSMLPFLAGSAARPFSCL